MSQKATKDIISIKIFFLIVENIQYVNKMIPLSMIDIIAVICNIVNLVISSMLVKKYDEYSSANPSATVLRQYFHQQYSKI